MKNKPVPTLTDEAVKKLALDCVNGLVFTDRHLRQAGYENLLTKVFMPIAFGAFHDCLDDIGMVYEYLDQAQTMKINGFPVFLSCYKLTVQEATAFNSYLKKYYDAIGSV